MNPLTESGAVGKQRDLPCVYLSTDVIIPRLDSALLHARRYLCELPLYCE